MLQELSHMDRITQLQDEIQQVGFRIVFRLTSVMLILVSASYYHV
jgi:hypothetical protein